MITEAKGGRPSIAPADIADALAPLARLPGKHLTVVLDESPSMAVWQERISGLLSRLMSGGSFTAVTTRQVDSSAGPIDPAPSGEASDEVGAMVIITDGAGRFWQHRTTAATLRRWAQRRPLAILQLLPQEHWYRTGIRPRRVKLRSSSAGAVNADAEWKLREPVPTAGMAESEQSIPQDAVPVPVLEMNPAWLKGWVTMVTGSASDWIRVPALLSAPAEEGRGEPPTLEELDPFAWHPIPETARRQVDDFTAWASPTAITLASQLAAAPLSVPLMRTVQRRLLPDSDISHLSEVINSGLVRPVATTAADRPEQVSFDFDDGVREELLAGGRRSDTMRVLQIVDECLGEIVPAVNGLTRVLEDPDGADVPRREITSETRAFVQIEQAALQALSGRYLRRARELLAELDLTAHYRDTVSPRGTDPHPYGPADSDDRAEGTGVSAEAITDRPGTVAGSDRSSPPSIWGNVPPRNANFTGREELLRQLHTQMAAGTTAVLPQAVHGMGGVGKTQLAVEYVYRHQNDYDLIWWITSERATQARTSLAALARRMGLAASQHVNAVVPVVLDSLRRGEPYERWLLIFDNAESPESLGDLLPTGGPGRILVTSRDPRWEQRATPLEVDVFQREETLRLLSRRRPDLPTALANQIAEELGDLPLAVEQAATWLAETGMPAEEYLRLFREKRQAMMSVSTPLDYPLPVAAAWNVSLDRLARNDPAALRLLQLCSFLASEPIHRTLFNAARYVDIHPELNVALQDPVRLNQAIREINRYALAKHIYSDNSFYMHRLIQAVLVDRMSTDERVQMRGGAHALLAANDRHDPVNPDNWVSYAALYPHVIASDAHRSTDPAVQLLVENVARYLFYLGDHAESLRLTREIFDLRLEQLGPDHENTLSIGRWLGWMLFVTGKFAEAERHNKEMLSAHERKYPTDTEQLLNAAGAVAADHRVAGRFGQSLQVSEDVYNRHVIAFGDDIPETLNAAHNLAVALRLTGDFQRALAVDTDTWNRRSRTLGPDHLDTLQSAQSMVIDRRELGDYTGAQKAQQRAVDQLLGLLDPDHPQVLRGIHRLSVAMRKAGHHRDARERAEQSRDGYARRYGDDHPDTIATSLSLAIDLRATGALDESAALSKEVFHRYRSMLGAEHPHTVVATLNGAVAERRRGDHELALRMNREGYDILRASLGEDHPHALASALNLASDLFALERFAEAREMDAETAERLTALWGDDHPTTLACRGNLAMDILAVGLRDDALALQAETVARFRRVLEPHHPAVAAANDLQQRADCDLDSMPL